MNFSTKVREEPSIDVTPLLDIVFQLVLFFMVSTTFDESPALEIELPQSSSRSVVQEDLNIEVWVDSNGAYFVEQQPVSLENLQNRIQDGLSQNPELVFIIKADEKTAHGSVVELMDAAQEMGVNHLTVGAKGKQ